jgi:hypothetical protein
MRGLVLFAALASCAPKAVVAARPPGMAAPQPAVAAVIPIADPDCEKVLFPSVGASVVFIPGETMTRALMPVVRAACACTRPGDRLRLTATIHSAGIVTAVAHDDDRTDACIQQVIDGHFAPGLELGSDCIDCGSKRYPIFRGATRSSPPGPEPSRITYPFTLVHGSARR